MDISALRNIAKSEDYQVLYSRCKELGFLRLFKNDSDYTRIQILFLYWLEVYSSLYSDLIMEKANIDEEVINDEIRAEAYLLWRRRKKEEEIEGKKKGNPILSNNLPTLLFKRK